MFMSDNEKPCNLDNRVLAKLQKGEIRAHIPMKYPIVASSVRSIFPHPCNSNIFAFKGKHSHFSSDAKSSEPNRRWFKVDFYIFTEFLLFDMVLV